MRILHTLRQLKHKRTLELRPEHGTQFVSNDYLSFQEDKRWHEFVKQKTPTSREVVSSRLIAGNTKETFAIEEYFASIFASETSLFFPNGFMANLGVFSTLPQKDEVVLYDAYCHASIREGLRLCPARSVRWRHNDTDDLESKLKQHSTNGTTVFVAVESLYSMHGDFCPLKEVDRLCNKYNAHLIVDEAHSGGVVHRGGLSRLCGLQPFLRIYTFGKAYSSHGAVVCCSAEVQDALVNFCRPFIYSTAPSVEQMQHAQRSVEYWQPAHSKELQEKIVEIEAKTGWQLPTLSQGEKSPILSLLITQHSEKVKDVLEREREAGVFYRMILPPTVPQGEIRVRIPIRRSIDTGEIELLCRFKKALDSL